MKFRNNLHENLYRLFIVNFIGMNDGYADEYLSQHIREWILDLFPKGNYKGEE